MGTSGKRGTKEGNLKTGAYPEDQGCRGLPPEQQNVMAVSVQHCTVTTAPCNCCPNCYAEQSHKDNVCSSAIGKPLKQKKSNSLVQHHLPALDLFRASFFMRVQLTSLLLISPGLWWYKPLKVLILDKTCYEKPGSFTSNFRNSLCNYSPTVSRQTISRRRI